MRELEASDRALALDSTNVDMWFLRAHIAEAIDPTSRKASIHSLRRMLAIDSLNASAWQALGWALEETGDRNGALAAMRRGIALGHNPIGLANHYYWWREFDGAAVWADSAVVVDPQLAWTHETVGAIALAQGSDISSLPRRPGGDCRGARRLECVGVHPAGGGCRRFGRPQCARGQGATSSPLSSIASK